MKHSDIVVGETYINRGAGKTRRTVLAIGEEHRPKVWYSPNPRPQEPGVRYKQGDYEGNLYLSSFAQWAGRKA